MGGSFQTNREIFNHPIWQDVTKFRIFFYIVGNAVFTQDGLKIGNITVQRGQFLRSYRNLRQDLEYKEKKAIKMYSLSSISRKIDQLVKEERLKIEDTDMGTLFTVVNYEQYQGFEQYKKNDTETVLEQYGNGTGTVLEQYGNNNKNVKKVKKDNKDKKTSRHKFETCDLELAELLFQKMRENNPTVKKPNLESWANEVRLMRQIDKRTIEQILYLIDWTQKDSFWRSNVLSIAKLRKQYDTLVLRVKESKAGKGNNNGKTTDAERLAKEYDLGF